MASIRSLRLTLAKFMSRKYVLQVGHRGAVRVASKVAKERLNGVIVRGNGLGELSMRLGSVNGHPHTMGDNEKCLVHHRPVDCRVRNLPRFESHEPFVDRCLAKLGFSKSRHTVCPDAHRACQSQKELAMAVLPWSCSRETVGPPKVEVFSRL